MPETKRGDATHRSVLRHLICLYALAAFAVTAGVAFAADSPRERIFLNDNWRFSKGDPNGDSTGLIYDVRPDLRDRRDDRAADSEPTEAERIAATNKAMLKPWILPTANDFIKDPVKRHARPDGEPPRQVAFTRFDFDDSAWRQVNLPHDWAIEGPFNVNRPDGVGGGMGRLPSPGIGWYRKKLDIPASDAGKSIFLDVDGAMSYAMVRGGSGWGTLGSVPQYAWVDVPPHRSGRSRAPSGGNQVFADNSAQWIKYDSMFLFHRYPGADGVRQFFWYQKPIDFTDINPLLLQNFLRNISAVNVP